MESSEINEKIPVTDILCPLDGGIFLLEWVAVSLLPSKRHQIEKFLNSKKTGELVFVEFPRSEDNFYLFIRDAHNPLSKVISLGEHRYSSPQGSDSAFWSKDRMMCAIHSESAERFVDGPPWRGYDWTTHRVLDSSQIAKAFKLHGGKGQEAYPVNRRWATPEEEKLFDLNAKIQ